VLEFEVAWRRNMASAADVRVGKTCQWTTTQRAGTLAFRDSL